MHEQNENFIKETETIKNNQTEILKPATTLTGEFYQIFKEELMQSSNFSKEKLKRREHSQTHFMRPALS